MPRINSTMNLRPGNGIARQYKNAKIMRRVAAGIGLMEFGMASMTAMNKSLLPTLIIGAFTFRMIGQVEKAHNKMLELRPKYEKILEKAKRVFKSK